MEDAGAQAEMMGSKTARGFVVSSLVPLVITGCRSATPEAIKKSLKDTYRTVIIVVGMI